ncbi:MAG: acetyl-CoA carboxylase biotin carboxyl carrier protein [bacterium]
MEIKDIKKFIELIDETDITELNWEKEGLKVGFKKGAAVEITGMKTRKPAASGPENVTVTQTAASEAKENAAKEEAIANDNLVTVKAPIVGTFYRASSPDAPSLVEEGSLVEKGQKLCVIEAMKVMKEILAEVSGKVTKILVDNGAHIEYGQDIFIIDTKAKK